ncbi:Carbohydrate esterase 4 protein [Linnemannia schmuckeri]|uniref:Carbohydrate esterase 4 protein n=1 Tax=Linnemannia schmuckeri TaxID=64567 RepID=A0A9P5UWT0_9FUNG|nr:Carbohydrate esterase 4 protein [Linnemannia schmuckeri]
MRFSSISILAAILTISYQASAAPVPSSTTPANSIAQLPSSFPYKVSGPTPPSLYHPGQVLDTCTRPNSYAISFDDGPGQLTDELLDYLDEQRLKVTFFMNGDNWNCIYRPESQRLLKRAFNAQHQIASHPWSHRDLETLSEREIRQEMYRIEDAFRDILGVVPKYMRPPYGEHSERVRKIMESMGYVMILWDVDQITSSSNGAETTSDKIIEDSSSLTQTGDRIYKNQRPMGSGSSTASSHRHQPKTEFSSKWAEAVRGVPSMTLDRDDMMMGGIYQEATSVWAVEYVQSLGMDIMPVGACMGETDPRLWYNEISEPAEADSLPSTCYNY